MVVLDGVAGVQVQSEKVWRQADQYAIPRLIFVNKLDRLGADIHHVLRTIEGSLGVQPLLLQLPLHRQDAASTTEPTPTPAHVPATAQPLTPLGKQSKWRAIALASCTALGQLET